MLDPDQACDLFFLYLPPNLDRILLEKGVMDVWDNTTPEIRAELHKEFETYARLVTNMKTSR